MKYSRGITVCFGLCTVMLGFHAYNSFPTLSPAAEEGLWYGVTLSNVMGVFFFFMFGLNRWKSRISFDGAADMPKKDANTSSRFNPSFLTAVFALLYIVVPILSAILLTLQP